MPSPIVFDVETKHSFREVGNDTRKLGVSVVAAYDYGTDRLYAFRETELHNLFSLFEKASLLIGYNSHSFDLVVLNEYYVGDLFKFEHFDLLEDIKTLTGRRYPLDDLVRATLGKNKSGHGLQAIELYNQGKIDELMAYCKDDVMLTRDLLDFGTKNGYILAPSPKSKIKIGVEWKKIVDKKRTGGNHNLTLGF